MATDLGAGDRTVEGRRTVDTVTSTILDDTIDHRGGIPVRIPVDQQGLPAGAEARTRDGHRIAGAGHDSWILDVFDHTILDDRILGSGRDIREEIDSVPRVLNRTMPDGVAGQMKSNRPRTIADIAVFQPAVVVTVQGKDDAAPVLGLRGGLTGGEGDGVGLGTNGHQQAIDRQRIVAVEDHRDAGLDSEGVGGLDADLAFDVVGLARFEHPGQRPGEDSRDRQQLDAWQDGVRSDQLVQLVLRDIAGMVVFDVVGAGDEVQGVVAVGVGQGAVGDRVGRVGHEDNRRSRVVGSFGQGGRSRGLDRQGRARGQDQGQQDKCEQAGTPGNCHYGKLLAGNRITPPKSVS